MARAEISAREINPRQLVHTLAEMRKVKSSIFRTYLRLRDYLPLR